MRRALTLVLICLVLQSGVAHAAAPNDEGWYQQWHLRTIHADMAWTRSRGSGVVVAVIDTGVDLSHPDLKGRLVGGIDLVDGGAPDDRQGHGTFMAGLIAATTNNVEGVASVAPLAKIMPVRALDSNGTGKPSVVAEGIDWAVRNGADVINLSLAQEPLGGGGGFDGTNLFADEAMDRAINDAANAGALVIAAAGNSFSGSGGSESTSYDATSGGVLVVGASTKTDRRARYSNFGSGLDVLAPGGGSSSDPSNAACQSTYPVVSTWWNPKNGDSTYGAGCGTSMAVAHVSGVGALLMARGSSNVAAAKRITGTAVDLYGSGWDEQSGHGRVDAAAAVGATSAVSSPPKPKPKPKPSSTPRRVGTAAGKTAVGGTKVSPPATPTPSPIRALALDRALPYTPPPDTRERMIALALALAVAVGIGHVAAGRAVSPRR